MTLVRFDAFSTTEQLTLVAQCGFAAMLGAALGLERELAGKRAGIRTHMIVAAASCMAIGLGVLLGQSYPGGDPTRTLHAVITGVGFIGAGAIIHSKKAASGPSGLTTAATILLVALLGAACALGAPILAGLVTVVALMTLRGLRPIEHGVRRWFDRRRAKAKAQGDVLEVLDIEDVESVESVEDGADGEVV